jgi:nucleolar protein 56
VDESAWQESRTASALADRLALLSTGRMTEEASTLSQRFPEAIAISCAEIDDWPELTAEHAALLAEATIKLAERGVAVSAADPDRRLEHLVHATDEMRKAHNTLESRLVEWVGMFLPQLDLDGRRSEIPKAVSASSDLAGLGVALEISTADVDLGPAEWSSLCATGMEVVALESSLNGFESAVRELASTHLPSLSLLLGPLLAARLSVTAHGRARLARLPASTVQVLGAEKAFFMHLAQGTDPPKHGHIFQHPWICRSPRWMRGSLSRMLAAKAAIAARVDHFGGEPWTSKQVAEVEQKVGEIRRRRARR